MKVDVQGAGLEKAVSCLNKENPGAPIAEFQEGVSGDCGEDIFGGLKSRQKDFYCVQGNCEK